MKTSKRSLITAIAVLCVCALSLSAASFAWFTSVTTANVNTMNMSVINQSDLKIAVDKAALTAIEGPLWGVKFSGQDIADVQNTYKETGDPNYNALSNVFYNGTQGFQLPDPGEDKTLIDPVTGFYKGDTYTNATAGEQYLSFIVYFRTTKENAVIKFTGSRFALQEDSAQKKQLLPALTLRVNGVDYSNTSEADDVQKLTVGINEDGTAQLEDRTVSDITTGGTVTTCSTANGGYYTGQAEFCIYVEGEHCNTINQNAGIDFVLSNLNFSIEGE